MTFDPSELRLSILEGTETEVAALHEVLQGAEDYSMSISGARPTRQDGCEVFESITGVRVPYQSGSVISQSMIFEKSL